MSKNRPDAGTFDIPIQRAIFGRTARVFEIASACWAWRRAPSQNVNADRDLSASSLAMLKRRQTLPENCYKRGLKRNALGGIMMFTRPLTALVLAASILAAETNSAQTYPSHPITLVARFPPGGATDTIARIMQDSMSKSLGQQIIIENVGGAGGSIGAARAARAAPDGYTVLLHNPAVAIAMTLYAKPGFDTEKDFIAI